MTECLKSVNFSIARTRVGKQCFINRLDCVNKLNFNLFGDYSKDYILGLISRDNFSKSDKHICRFTNSEFQAVACRKALGKWCKIL